MEADTLEARAKRPFSEMIAMDDENPTIGDNSGVEIDALTKQANELFVEADKAGEPQRIAAGRVLLKLRPLVEAAGHKWRPWCGVASQEGHIRRSYTDIVRVMEFASGGMVALEDARAKHRQLQADDRQRTREIKIAVGEPVDRRRTDTVERVREAKEANPGLSNRAIAKQLGLGAKTVDMAVRRNAVDAGARCPDLRTPLRDKFGDDKPHLISNAVKHIEEELGARLDGFDVKAELERTLRDMGSRQYKGETVAVNGASFKITPAAITIPLSEIEAKIMPHIEELRTLVAGKTQIQMSPIDILTAVERIEECLDLWAGRPSKFEKRKAERLARMHK